MTEQATSMPDRSQPTRVFQIPPTYTWVASIVMLVLSLIVPVIVLLAGGNRNTLFSVIVVIITAILVVVGIVIYVSLVSARLAVNAGGISYFSSGVTIRAAWARVAGYGSTGSGRRKGLILYPEPVSEAAEPKPVRVKLSSGDPRRQIPLFPFDQNWQNGEIGHLIRTYAPQALRELDPVNLAEFDRNAPPPTLANPDPAPDETALASHPRFTRTDALIIGADILLTAWALVLVFML